jgi:hypothetical protein
LVSLITFNGGSGTVYFGGSAFLTGFISGVFFSSSDYSSKIFFFGGSGFLPIII